MKNTTQKPRLLWPNVLTFIITGFIALVVVPYYAISVGFDIYQVAALVFGFVFAELSITAGYHRLWSHRAYEANKWVRWIFAFGSVFAIQGSILRWAAYHRRHHRHVDDYEKDPYSASRGFWFSHIGWMIREYQEDKVDDFNNVRDLQKDPIVMWQHRHYIPLTLVLNFAIPLLLGVLHGDILGMMLLAGVFRLVLNHHFTFFINSLAHMWGSQPYTDENTAKDNAILAVFTMGEGYHNFHHYFQADYRNGIRWWQFDPTKWLIRSLNLVGMTKNLRRAPEERIEKARAKMLLTRSTAKVANLPNAEALRKRLTDEYETLLVKMNEFYATQKQWLEIKKTAVVESYDKTAVYKKYQELKHLLGEQRKNWLMLNAQFA